MKAYTRQSVGGMGVNEENKQWLLHYPQEIPPSINYPEQNIVHFLKKTAAEFPNYCVFDFLGKKTTYRQLLEKVYRFANALRSLGVEKGDRVAIMLPNCPQAVIGYYGALLIGAIVVQTNPLYVERELEHQMKDSGAKVILSLDLLYRRIMKVKGNTDLVHLIITSIKDELPFPKNLLYPLKLKKEGMQVKVDYDEVTHRYGTIMEKAALDSSVEEEVDAKEDLALLQYTGGTTGAAKGVMLTHFNLVANTSQAIAWFYQSEKGQEKILAVLPFFHVYGMTVIMNFAIAIGASMTLQPRFDPGEVLKAINRTNPTIFPGAPTMYIALLQHPDLNKYKISSIKACLSGAAPLPLEVQQQFESLTGGRLVEGYGLTEASPVTHANPIWGKRKNGTIGLPWPDTDCRILNIETGEELSLPEQVGELAVKGPQVMKGYWQRPEETSKTLKDGWLLTGDIATMDEDGYFTIVDRKKDMIIAGGFNIYPREVEEVLYEHPKVLEAAVIGVADLYRGETVKAFIVVKKGEQVSEEELNDYCRSKLAAYKVPRHYEFRADLPKTLIGKVLRRELVEEEKRKS
jgi:long-chain acyl-CoA synthetase